MKHKILGVAALLCAMLFAACSDLLEDLTPKETSSVEVETTADTDLYVHILEISGDFTLESEQSGTELRFTALDTEPGANLVWKVYKGLEDTAYTQSGSDTSFGFDTGDLEPGKYTLLVTSGTRSAAAVFTVNTTVTVPVTLKTGGDINSILVQLCKAEWEASACTKFARSVTNNEKATLYLDTEGKYIPVWSVDSEVYYYVPDGCTPVMNEDSSKMFGYCYNLSSLDVGSFDTSKVTNMSSMFSYCSKLTNLNLSSFNTGSVTNMNGMFSGCSGLTSLDVSKFDTSNVTDMSRMFSDCSGLTSLDVGSFDTSKVTNMSSMFSYCSKLTNLNLSSFNTGSVTIMNGMFSGCSGLTSLDVSSFNTSKVTDMNSMFYCCSGLTSLDVGSFNTGSVTNMYIMFSCCSGLTSLDVSSFNTSKVTNMSYMFYSSPALTTIYATSNFVTTNVTSGDYCFGSCTNLKGGAGTTWDSSRESADYARIDGGTDAPGYFKAKPIGSKSKPDAVGDIVFNDGSATPYTADLTLTDEQKAAAIALIFYVGTDCSNDSTSRTLGVGLAQNQSGLAWCLESAAAHDKNITTIQESDKDGSDNFSQIGEFLDDNDDTDTADKYPAFYFAKNYASQTGSNVSGTVYKDGWYLPAKAELQKIYDILSTVNKELAACGGTTFETTGVYWSSSQDDYFDSGADRLSFDDEDWGSRYKSMDSTFVCAVRAF